MGYRTQFGGELTITPPLTKSEHDRLLELCRLDNPRAEDVFEVTAKATDADREILGKLVEMLPWSVLFYEWRIGPCRNRKINDHGHEPGECWTVEPPDSEISGGYGDVEMELVFLHSWLTANGHELSGELSWSGSDAGGDTGVVYVDPVHGVEAVEDIHDNPGPSWSKAAQKEANRQEAIYQRIVGGDDSPFVPTLKQLEEWPIGDWQHDVVNGYTKLGYTDWIEHKLEADSKTPEGIGKDWAREQLAKQGVYVEPEADRKLYVIEFLYADNNQLYQTFARLTDEERERVEQYLNKLDENGDICLASSAYTCEWTDIVPHPSLKELAEEFAENTAFDGPREECGIVLEVVSAKGN